MLGRRGSEDIAHPQLQRVRLFVQRGGLVHGVGLVPQHPERVQHPGRAVAVADRPRLRQRVGVEPLGPGAVAEFVGDRAQVEQRPPGHLAQPGGAGGGHGLAQPPGRLVRLAAQPRRDTEHPVGPGPHGLGDRGCDPGDPVGGVARLPGDRHGLSELRQHQVRPAAHRAKLGPQHLGVPGQPGRRVTAQAERLRHLAALQQALRQPPGDLGAHRRGAGRVSAAR